MLRTYFTDEIKGIHKQKYDSVHLRTLSRYYFKTEYLLVYVLAQIKKERTTILILEPFIKTISFLLEVLIFCQAH